MNARTTTTPSTETAAPAASLRQKEKVDAGKKRYKRLVLRYLATRNPRALFPGIAAAVTCSNKKLTSGEGPYRDWFFRGNAPHVDAEGFRAGTLDAFKTPDFLRSLAERPGGVAFGPISAVRNTFLGLVRSCITGVRFDTRTQDNISDAVRWANRDGLKLVIPANHNNHIDATAALIALDRASDGLLRHDAMFVRCLCGVFMAYDMATRVFVPAAHTAFVLGPKDKAAMNQYLRRGSGLPEEERRRLWDKLDELTDQARHMGIGLEAMLMYLYAGRAPNQIGCKATLPPQMRGQLTDPRCLYLPTALIGTNRLLSFVPDPVVQKYPAFERDSLLIKADKAFVGGTVDLPEFHARMVSTATAALLEYGKPNVNRPFGVESSLPVGPCD